MNDEILKSISDSLARIAQCMENKQAREIAESRKKIQESKRTPAKPSKK